MGKTGMQKTAKPPQKPILQVAVREPFLTVKPIAVSELKDEEKIPKENIILIPELASGGRKPALLLNCTVRKHVWLDDGTIGLNVLGEYRGSCSPWVTLFAMAYNAENQLIGYTECAQIGDYFYGEASFSAYMQIPCDETLSKIVLRYVRKVF